MTHPSYIVEDFTHLCKRRTGPGKPYHKTRRVDAVNRIVVHRSHFSNDPEETARCFDDVKLGTGGKMPYHVFITDEGKVCQCLPFWANGPGAMGVNKVAIHVAVHGDMRARPPTVAQALKLIAVCNDLLCWANHGIALFGHTELAHSSTDPLKECPGRRLNMNGLRAELVESFKPWDGDRNAILEDKGWIINLK